MGSAQRAPVEVPNIISRGDRGARRTGSARSTRAYRILAAALAAGAVLATTLPAQARVDTGLALPQPENQLPHFPDPMAAVASASTTAHPSGSALDPRFAIKDAAPETTCSAPAKPSAGDRVSERNGLRHPGVTNVCTATGHQRSPAADMGPARAHGGSAADMTGAAPTMASAADYSWGSPLPSTPGGGGSSPDWVQRTTPTAPSFRFAYGMTFDAARSQIVFFGGANYGLFNETWVWSGTGWTQKFPASSPPVRRYPQMAYDPAIQRVILFGGQSDLNWSATADTWSWDGSNWTQLSPATAPPAREGGTMEYLPSIGKLVLFGGSNSGRTDDLSDTWTFNGSNWAQISPSTVPPKRDGAGMTFDGARGNLVMFGGNTCGAPPCTAFTEIGDTWVFDGANWTQKNPIGAPGPRDNFGFVFDTAINKTVMFGGDVDQGNTVTFLNDTWLWDGADWTQASGIASPSGRSDMQAAYLANRQQVVMFGGDNLDGSGGSVFADTWTYDTAVPTVTKTVDRAGSPPIYSRGETVGYTVTVGNTSTVTLSNISLQDTLQPGLVAGGAPIKVNGGACPAGATCVSGPQSISLQGLTIPAGGSITITYSALAVGADRQCSNVLNAAQASGAYGGSAVNQVPVTICDGGLGIENWWSYVSRPVGPQAVARVNVANGNMVLQQDDFTPVQIHGHLGLGLRRTYNSEDTSLLNLPGSSGKGWTFNISEAGDLAGDGVRADGLYVPTLESLLSPLAVTLIDQDGTRHAFQPKGIGTVVDVTALQTAASPGARAALIPKVLQLDTGYVRLCVDQTFSAPPGVHLGLWRYVETSGASCGGMTAANTVVLGFVAERPDRLRSEFSWDGHLLDLQDGAGNEIRYTYTNAPAAGANLTLLASISEPATGRGFSFSYPAATEADIVDPGGRIGRYTFDAGLNPHLKEVATYARDGATLLSDVKYTYGGCGGTADQMCSTTDPRADTTTFTYRTTYSNAAPFLGPPKLAGLTDRRGTATSFSYSASPDTFTADESGQRRLFQAIDASGRVGEIDAGDTGGTVLNQTLNTWDAAGGTTCRQPDNLVDNHLCTTTRKSLSAGTPDEVTSYLYNAEGGLLRQRQANSGGNLDSTYGYHAQYVQADASVRCFDDTVAGSGTVNSAAVSSPAPCATGTRGDGGTLFTVSDRVQALTPRGNAAGAGFGPYLTSLKMDNNASVSPNAKPPGTVCTNPAAPSANTGSLCERDEPVFDGSHATVTRYVYDSYGQKVSMTTPKAIADGGGSYTYAYYRDPSQSTDVTQTRDLSGNTATGGWLKGVTDPTGAFVAFAYDAAGNVARSWDRDATQSAPFIGMYPGTSGSPPVGTYIEKLHGSGTFAYSSPWRYLRSSRDQLGNLTTYTDDSNGNQTAIRPPRGNAANNGSYDITQVFDSGDNLASTLMPAEAAGNNPTGYSYDAIGNRVSTTDPRGNVTTNQYDSVNRPAGTTFTRGPWPGDGSQPAACRQSTTSDAPIPAGRVLCSTSVAYDGVDNATSANDGNAQRTDSTFDGVHRKIKREGPRLVSASGGGSIRTRTDTIYDADGHVLDACPTREFSEGGGSCTHTAFYSQHQDYDVFGRPQDSYTYRSSGGAQNRTTFAYDADGNSSAVTDPNSHTTIRAFDLLDRKTSETVPRDASSANTTFWNYDPAGNTTAVIRPGPLDAGSGADGALVVDGSSYPRSSPYLLSGTKNFTSLTLQNGGWAAMAQADTNATLQVHVVGTTAICPTCGISVSAAGPQGGLPGQAQLASGQAGNGSGQGGGGGGAAANGGGGGRRHADAGARASMGTAAGSGGSGGSAYASAELRRFRQRHPGDGPGGGGGGDGVAQHGGLGGAGGGILHLTSTTIDDKGTISADGACASADHCCRGRGRRRRRGWLRGVGMAHSPDSGAGELERGHHRGRAGRTGRQRWRGRSQGPGSHRRRPADRPRRHGQRQLGQLQAGLRGPHDRL